MCELFGVDPAQDVEHEPKSTVLDSISQLHIAAIQKQIESQVPETKSCKEPTIKQEVHETFGPFLLFTYAPHGETHDSNTLKIFVNLIEGTVKYNCTTLEPIKKALRLRPAFNDHTQSNDIDEDNLVWQLKEIARKQVSVRAKLIKHPDPRKRDQQVAKREFMKKAMPLINKCFAFIKGKRTTVAQRCVSHGLGQKQVVSYEYRDLRTMREQFDWTVTVREFRILDASPENYKRLEYDVTFAPIVEWLTSQEKLTFRKKVFNPRPYGTAKCASADELNLFTGIDYPMTKELTKEEMKEAEDGPLKPFIDHIKHIWCANAPDAFPWVMMFLAFTVARPWIKVMVAIVLKSLPRSGKGVIIAKIKEILGDKYVSLPGTIEDVTEKQFNSQYTANCLLMFLDEAFWGGSRKSKGGIKKLVTEPYTNVEEKFVTGFTTDACWNTIFASNERHVINMDICSGKMVALDVSNKWAGASSDPTAKKKYMDAVRNTDAQLLSNYFHALVDDSWNPSNIPLTHASMDQMLRSLSPEHKFILQVLSDPTTLMGRGRDGVGRDGDVRIDSYEVFDGASVDRRAVYEHYKKSCRRHVSPKMFWKEWKACIPGTELPPTTVRNEYGNQTRSILLPTLEEARASFRAALHMPDLTFE